MADSKEDFKRKFKALKKEKKKEVYLKVLEDALGNVTVATRACGVDRSNHYLWAKDDEDFQKKVEDINDISLDFAEGALMKNVKAGKESSIFYYLNNKGKSRGYTPHFKVDANVSHDVSKLEKVLENADEDMKNSLLKIAENISDD